MLSYIYKELYKEVRLGREARRREEDLKTQAAATAAAKQHRISEEARQREVQLRAQMRRSNRLFRWPFSMLSARFAWFERPFRLQGIAFSLKDPLYSACRA